MTSELLYYLLIYTIGILFSITYIQYDLRSFLFYLLIVTIFSIITRYSGFDKDMINYADRLSSTSLSFYYLREPFIWLLSRGLFRLLGSAETTFILFDIFSFILIYKSMKNFNFPFYTIFIFILFFTSILGLNNIYRQYMAFCFILYFLSLCYRGTNIVFSGIVFIFAVLSHNVAALFAPVFFVYYKGSKRKLFFFISSAVILLLLPVAAATKSDAETGRVSIKLYLFIQILFFLFFTFNKLRNFDKVSKLWSLAICYMIALTLVADLFMGSAQSKRIGMLSLSICLIPLIDVIESKYKPTIFARILALTILTAPTLLFYSSRSFLLT